MVWVALLMIERCMAPTVKLDVQSPRPQIPLPTPNPLRLAVTVTLAPDGQNVAGRKCTTSAASQCQPPMTAGVDVTWMRSRSAARSPAGIEVLKRRSIVSPTPTTAPSSGVIPVSSRLLAVSVHERSTLRWMSSPRCSSPWPPPCSAPPGQAPGPSATSSRRVTSTPGDGVDEPASLSDTVSRCPVLDGDDHGRVKADALRRVGRG